MSRCKILVFFIIASCHGHHIYLQKGLEIKHDGILPRIMAFIHGKWIPFAKIETKSVHKRESESEGDNLPLKVVMPAPVIEHVEEKETLDVSSLFGYQQPEPGFYRVPLTRSIGPGLNTDIKESLSLVQLTPIPVPQRAGEIFEGLPPRPIEPVPAVGPVPVAEKELPPPTPPITPVQETPPPPALFDKTRVRQYAVYAGDVILKYLSQFFNRARITYNRFTSPPPPTPVYEN